ncbi:transglutaminase-like cysteine peptidase [Mesorhizobium sp. Z1-4]|uniref:transglutaminase-like cysteine peptidase n=1 Tax=Mesorhizobium sp. Z1-4 TaxID=2448478 RepID=UPI000FDCC6B0|nr:transglutaminase-like cysteine peptidase [Mesorhizobium sp. Z1-4]
MFEKSQASIVSVFIGVALVIAASTCVAGPITERMASVKSENRPSILAERIRSNQANIMPVVSALLEQHPQSMRASMHGGLTAAAYLRDNLGTGLLLKRPSKAKRPVAARNNTTLFKSIGIPFGKLPAMERMRSVEMDIEAGFLNNCASHGCWRAARSLNTLIRDKAQGGFTRLLTSVNTGVNKLIRYQPDRNAYRVTDFWANPSTTLNRGAGDCEDYAILKMAVLAEAGVPRSAMSIVVLRDQSRAVYHAVLSIRTTQGNLILDNVRDDILTDDELPDYVPLYSLSGDRGHIFGRPVGGSRMVASLTGLNGIAPGEGQYPDVRAKAPQPMAVGPF